jgi:hypothetical protein
MAAGFMLRNPRPFARKFAIARELPPRGFPKRTMPGSRQQRTQFCAWMRDHFAQNSLHNFATVARVNEY